MTSCTNNLVKIIIITTIEMNGFWAVDWDANFEGFPFCYPPKIVWSTNMDAPTFGKKVSGTEEG